MSFKYQERALFLSSMLLPTTHSCKFSVVKSLLGGGDRTPFPTSKWQLSVVAMFAVYRIRCYLSFKISLNVFGKNIKNPI